MINPTQWGDIITNGEIPIICHNIELKITWCNSAANKILDIDGVVGKSIFDLSTSDSSKIPKYHKQVVTKKKIHLFLCMFKHQKVTIFTS